MRRAVLLLAPVVAFGAAPDPLVASPMRSTSSAAGVAVVIRDVDDRVAPAFGQAGHGAATGEAWQRDPRGVGEVARVVGATGRGEGRAVDARLQGVHACGVADLPVRRQPDPVRVPGQRAAPVLDAADFGEPGGAGATVTSVSTDRLWSEGRGLSVVRVPEGSYAMGVNPSDPYRLHRPGVRNGPVSVTITEAFWMTQREVWKGLYLEVTVTHRAMYSPVYPPLDVGFRLVRPVR